jgi:hypothetical protein
MIKMNASRLQNGNCEISCQILSLSQGENKLNLKTGKVKYTYFIREIQIKKADIVLFSAYLSAAMASSPSWRFVHSSLKKNEKLTITCIDSLGKQEQVEYIILV